MTTEQTITIHHEPPSDTMDGDEIIFAYSDYYHKYFQTLAEDARRSWGSTFTAWYDPQLGEPVKPKRFVILEGPSGFYIRNIEIDATVATLIPTEEVAQAIVDIYERTAAGGER